MWCVYTCVWVHVMSFVDSWVCSRCVKDICARVSVVCGMYCVSVQEHKVWHLLLQFFWSQSFTQQHMFYSSKCTMCLPRPHFFNPPTPPLQLNLSTRKWLPKYLPNKVFALLCVPSVPNTHNDRSHEYRTRNPIQRSLFRAPISATKADLEERIVRIFLLLPLLL